MVEVNIHPIKARYNQRTDQIVLNNGMQGQFSPGVLHDNQLGMIVWRQKPTDCNDSVSQVYLGPAEAYEYTGGKAGEGLDLLGSSIVILDDNVGTQERSEDIWSYNTLKTYAGGDATRPR